MSARPTQVTGDILEYLREISSSEDQFLKQLRKKAKKNKIPDIAISAEQGRFMQFILKLINAKHVLEIGTLAGYSAITMARALPEEGKIITIETNKYNADYALEKFKEAGLENKIELINADAVDFLKNFKPQYEFDFIFLDADKENYPLYLEILTPLLKNGGIFAGDNAFAFGLINEKDESKIKSKNINQIRKFNKMLMEHNLYPTTTLVPVGDGLIMGIKQEK